MTVAISRLFTRAFELTSGQGTRCPRVLHAFSDLNRALRSNRDAKTFLKAEVFLRGFLVGGFTDGII